MEDDVEDPMQAVLDAPMGAHGQSENVRIELGGGEIISPLPRHRAAFFDPGPDHADHGQMGETRLVSIAARGEQPIDVVADEMAALLDAAVVGVGRLMNGFDGFSFRIGEEGDDVLMKDGSIGFEREQIAAAAGQPKAA